MIKSDLTEFHDFKFEPLGPGPYVLVACEESQRVCIAFREMGCNAFSCDILPCSGGHPEWHIQDDVTSYLNGFQLIKSVFFMTQDHTFRDMPLKWDLIVAHPPCTYLSNAGARWLYAGGKLNEERYAKGLAGKTFFMSILNADCARIAIENPIPSSIYDLPECSQIIQPYQFGEPWSKKTCLWLKGLDPLKPTEIIENYKPFCSSGSYSKSHDPKYRGASRKGGSAKSRSKTFEGIARAMAQQWTPLLLQEVSDV